MINSILSIVNKFIPDQTARDQIRVELESEMTKQMKIQSNVILQEMRSKKSWRRRLMLLCCSILALHYIMFTIIPYIVVLFNLNVYIAQDPGLSPFIVDMLKIGLVGYVGSETTLYGIEKWRKR